MLARPDKRTLLERVARFLDEEARPALADPALAYRALLAATLARQVAAELAAEDEREGRELARLRELVPDLELPAERRAAIEALARALRDRIRARSLSTIQLTRARALVRETLREELAVTNPRFDPEARVE
jgi:hypothetical protein